VSRRIGELGAGRRDEEGNRAEGSWQQTEGERAEARAEQRDGQDQNT
jgi:hypothetical protein